MQTTHSKLLLPLLLLLSLFAIGANAAEGDTELAPDLSLQRDLFVAAEKALESEDLAGFQQLKQQLTDYPLLPYLEFQELVHSLPEQTPERMRIALSGFADTPLQSQLLDHLLALLAKEGLWHSYLSFSQPGGGTERQCNRLQALIKTGRRQQAYPSVPALWLSGRSQPTACDPVFDAWITDGQLTQDLVWQRMALAMKGGKTRLARYLKRYLSEPEARWADSWLKLYNDPTRISQVRIDDPPHPMLAEMLTQAVQRLSWRNIDAAYQSWLGLSGQVAFSDWQHLQVARSLMGQLSRQETTLQSQQITALLPKQYLHLDSTLSEKQLQHALQTGDWELTLLTIEGLPKQEQQQDRWRYWQARALISLQRKDEGEAILKELSGDRSYYGFLAAQRLGDTPSLLHEKLDADPQLMHRLMRHPAMLRAYELHRLGRSLPARREWNLAMNRRSDDELRAAARLAEHWDWPSQAIITLARLRQWNDLELRFPLAHQAEITSLSEHAGIDTAWVFAILRQESAFMQDAKSSVGARGLMQLMPKTAEAVASELRQPFRSPDDLFQPKVNLKLGTGYLNKIYRRLQENPVLATAAYNAGPWRVERWLPKQTQAADIWIETVPYAETREYLKRVLAYTVIYNYRLGEDPSRPQTQWMQPIAAPASDSVTQPDKPASGA